MAVESDARGYATMRAFVSGEGSVSTVFSGLKGLDRKTVDAIYHRHQKELEALDPARSVILESIVGEYHAPVKRPPM